MGEIVNIVCMKWGTAYPALYVNKLYSMVKRNLTKDFNFICFTDDSNGIREEVVIQPLPEVEVPKAYQFSPWKKLGMFKKGLANLTGKIMFLDLDLIILENIDCFFDYMQTGQFYIIENWTTMGKNIGNSSVYCFEAGVFDFIYDNYNKNPLTACQQYSNEQEFLSRQIVNAGYKLNFWPDSWCKSFKRHCLPKSILSWFIEPLIPKDAKIIVFHGHPKPDEAAIGHWPGKFFKFIKPSPWINNFWK